MVPAAIQALRLRKFPKILFLVIENNFTPDLVEKRFFQGILKNNEK
jgi:hypothetical protein